MIKGKIAENVLNRSIFKLIRHRRKDVLKKPTVGTDCALISSGEEYICINSNPVTVVIEQAELSNKSKEDKLNEELYLEKYARKSLYYVGNNIACQGAEFIGVLVNVILPAYSEEKEIKTIMKTIEDECGKLNIEVLGGHTELLESVKEPLLVMVGVGKVNKENILDVKNVTPGNDIVMTKWAGMEGAAKLAYKGKEDLLGRYKEELVDGAIKLADEISVLQEANIAKENGALYMHDATSSGVYGALWELSCGIKHGIEVDLQQIPIKQEIVEVCEFYDVNPYLLSTRGVLLIVVEDGIKLVEELNKVGIDANIIGKVCEHNNKIVHNQDEMRYLDPPKA